jgi:hypothetical protein
MRSNPQLDAASGNEFGLTEQFSAPAICHR